MDGVERYAVEQNISRFIDLLAHEPRAQERLTLALLLKEEEDKFAKGVERCEAVQRWIERCDLHLARNNKLMEKASDANRTLLQSNGHAMRAIRDTLVSLHMTWSHEVDQASKFAGRD